MQKTFENRVEEKLGGPLTAQDIRILQVNLGYRCNMACKHCHVSAGPARSEAMDKTTIDQVLDLLAGHRIGVLDITGGARCSILSLRLGDISLLWTLLSRMPMCRNSFM